MCFSSLCQGIAGHGMEDGMEYQKYGVGRFATRKKINFYTAHVCKIY